MLASYSFMDTDDRHRCREGSYVQLVQVSEVKNSNDMEPEVRCGLQQVPETDNLSVSALATMVTALMKNVPTNAAPRDIGVFIQTGEQTYPTDPLGALGGKPEQRHVIRH